VPEENNPDVCTELFNRLYDDTFSEMRRYVAVRCTDTAYIQDILQETYLDYYRLILRKGAGYAENNRAVLYKIAKRKIYRYYSLKEKKKIFIPMSIPDGDSEETEITLSDPNSNFEDAVISKVESDRIWDIISTYPADTRKILYLFFYENMSHTEIADELHLNLSTVKNKLYRTIREISEKGERP